MNNLADIYIVNRDRDDIIRILKELCGSARYLIATAGANNLKAPYSVTKGTPLQIPCLVSNVPTTTTRRATTHRRNEIRRFFKRLNYLILIKLLNYLIELRR